MTPASEARLRGALAELGDALLDAIRAEAEALEDTPPALLDIETAGRRLGVSRTTMYAALLDRPGGIRSFRIGRRRLVPADAVAEYAGNGKARAALGSLALAQEADHDGLASR